MAWSLALYLFLADSYPAPEDPVRVALTYLGRHQNEDGSWGKRPETCGCLDADTPGFPGLPRVAPGEAVNRQVRSLIQRFSSDEIVEREEAVGRLIAFGDSAISGLYLGARSGDPEVAGRCWDVLGQIGSGHNLELTGLVLVAFASAGVCHLTQERYGGLRIGAPVFKGVQYLKKQQRKDGSFGAPSLRGNLIATAAMGLLWSYTGSKLYGDSASAGAHYVISREPRNPEEYRWKAFCIKIINDSGIPGISQEEFSAARRDFKGMPEPASRHEEVLMSTLLQGKIPDLAKSLKPVESDGLAPSELWILSLTMEYARRKGAPGVETWGKNMRQRIGWMKDDRKASCSRGSWKAPNFRRKLEVTAYRALTLGASKGWDYSLGRSN